MPPEGTLLPTGFDENPYGEYQVTLCRHSRSESIPIDRFVIGYEIQKHDKVSHRC
jgi:hypothetical protein